MANRWLGNATPLTTARALDATRSLFSNFKKEDRKGLDPGKYSKLKAQAETGLENKFDLMPSIQIDDDLEQLKNVYQILMSIEQFKRELHNYDLTDVFLIPNSMTYQSASNEYWPATGAGPIDLFANYGDADLTLVRQVSEFQMLRGQDYHAENLIWSGTKLLNSCEDRLRQKIEEQTKDFSLRHRTGPVYFKLMMCLIIASSSQALRAMAKRIEQLSLKEFKGENVIQAVSFLRTGISMLNDNNQLPGDIITLLTTGFKKCSTQAFETYITTLETNHETGVKTLTTEELLQLAETKYTNLVLVGGWDKGDSNDQQQSGFNLSEVECWNCGKKGHVCRDCYKPRDEDAIKRRQAAARSSRGGRGNRGGRGRGRGGHGGSGRGRGRGGGGRGNSNPPSTDPKKKPPGKGEPHSRPKSGAQGATEHWCGTCGMWGDHGTDTHKNNEQANVVGSTNDSTQEKKEEEPTETAGFVRAGVYSALKRPF